MLPRLFLKTLVLFLSLRLIFFALNFDFFNHLSLNELATSFWFGTRLDLIPTLYCSAIVVVIWFLVGRSWAPTILIGVVALSFTFLSLIDTHYYAFLKEHIGMEIFWQLTPSNNVSLWKYISEYWHTLITGLVVSLVYVYWVRRDFNKRGHTRLKELTSTMLWFLLFFFLARGGFRSRPIRSADAGLHVSEQGVALSINTGLYVFETWANPMNKPWFADSTLSNLRSTEVDTGDSIHKYNFVFIILESFGKEYTGLNGDMAVHYTPHLNELFGQSVNCTRAYANGLKSVDAVPAIFSGIPKLSGSSFIHSPYSSKKRPSVFNQLAKLGYSSSFFHGTDNNSMGFRTFLINQGLEAYYGINEYTGPKTTHDGNWGIYDHLYFDYALDVIDNQKPPFVSGIFTLSSHHPYALPDSLRNRFPEGDLDIHKSIGYTDYALHRFLEKCKTKSWFSNTIFIITADHSAQNQLHAYRTASGKYAVPLLLYAPSILSAQKITREVSHLDIFPTVLDLVKYPNRVPVLGNNIFDSTNTGVVHYDNNGYHITRDHWVMGFHHGKAQTLHDKNNDVNCLSDVIGQNSHRAKNMETRLKQEVSNYYELLSLPTDLN